MVEADQLEADIKLQQDGVSALNAAIRLLARREHSSFELKTKLMQRGIQAELSDMILKFVQLKNWQSNKRYAESYIRTRMDKGYGPLKVQYELQNKGVDSEDISFGLLEQEDSWEEAALRLLKKRYGSTRLLGGDRLRCQQYLYQRGFTLEIIKSALDRFCE